VLDWEFAHVGAPEEDIAWLCVRDWRFGELALAAGGVAERWAFYRAYERAAGAEVDAERIHFWEIFGNLRWALGCAHQAARYARGGVRDLELLAIGRRSAEMEYEALRLIEVGVS
jgi:aminoglycoside phosphotransferase (APT) family kinase protein